MAVEAEDETYSFVARRFDPAGLDEVRVKIDGDRTHTERLENRSERFQFEEQLSLTDSSIDARGGAKVGLGDRARDRRSIRGGSAATGPPPDVLTRP